MLSGEDWLFRPVLRGMVKGESLIDGTIDLAFIAVCNDAIDVEAENDRMVQEAAQRK